ncbi:hypothetical protein [Subtercola sp. RTI3]|uniref:hypothetical protein n=1 Tax=Subtercola sp. RTI3 TaxID=3048639 RepID=UPI002B233692|nr:hypothetical protein [Subtercola sp. RTI3]MEA9985783.1 hypothetical protein [Subtercola sp. RTI3]
MVDVAGGGIQLVIDVRDGARITSLIAHDREWLAPSRPREDGESFVAAGTGGWDEIAPTVGACVLADGTEMRDHGDAWRQPWHVEGNTMSVYLPTVGVTLHRTISATPVGLRFDYKATTESESPVPFLWALHPLFDATAGLRVVATGALINDEGSRVNWPSTTERGTAIKAFASGLAVASVVTPDGRALHMSWSLPHVGFYWDDGVYSDGPVIAIEPTTGRSDFASQVWDHLPTVRAGRPLTWWVEITP